MDQALLQSDYDSTECLGRLCDVLQSHRVYCRPEYPISQLLAIIPRLCMKSSREEVGGVSLFNNREGTRAENM